MPALSRCGIRRNNIFEASNWNSGRYLQKGRGNLDLEVLKFTIYKSTAHREESDCEVVNIPGTNWVSCPCTGTNTRYAI